jgi:hypothetical protein
MNISLQLQKAKKILKNFISQNNLNLKIHSGFGLIIHLIQGKILMVIF